MSIKDNDKAIEGLMGIGQAHDPHEKGNETKPPLGVAPRLIFLEGRLTDLRNAMKRYLDMYLPISIQWYDEYHELIVQIGNLKSSSQQLQDLHQSQHPQHHEGYLGLHNSPLSQSFPHPSYRQKTE
jgi:hypothetical protein